MATASYTSTLFAAQTLAAGASTVSAERDIGENVKVEAVHVFLDINASGFAGTPSTGPNTIDITLRPIALTGSATYDGGSGMYHRHHILGDSALAIHDVFYQPGGHTRYFKVAVFNRTDKATATSAMTGRIEYITVG